MRNGREAHQEIEGFIAEGTRMTGEIVLEGGFRIDGKVVGRLSSTSTLIVGPPGEVEAEELTASSLLVSGNVSGTLHVDERLEVQPGGCVTGKVTMKKPGLVVSPGGRFEGTVRMESPAAGPERAD